MTAPSPADRQAAEYAAVRPEAERIAREIVGAEPARWCIGLIAAALAAARADERERWITALGALAGRYNLRWFARELRRAVSVSGRPTPEGDPKA